MGPLLLLAGIGIVAIGLVVTVLVGRVQFDRQTDQIVTWLVGASDGTPPGPIREEEIDDLPPPIRRYLRNVLRPEQPYVETARLEQSGLFRTGDATSGWNSFTAVQYVTTNPPGFVWNATIRMIPGIPVRVVDEYRDGRGGLRAKLAGVLSVADAAPGDSLDEGELLRYLAEAPLYPTALLPSMGVDWTPIDDTCARATLEHNGTVASLLFRINEQDEVERVSGRRAFTKEDGTTESLAWAGDWWNYQRRDGMLVPTDGKVAWVRREGEFTYWRGHIDAIDYQFSTEHEANSESPASETDTIGQAYSLE